MFRIACALLIVGAALVGMLAASLTTEATYTARLRMMPSADWMGQKAHLHCKFHGVCGSSSGNGLDWHNWTTAGDTGVRWRTYVDLPHGGVVKITSSGNLVDSGRCDYFNFTIKDGNNVSRGTMTYVHANTTWASGTTASVNSGGWWHRFIGDMVWDGDCTFGWSGTHVHEKSSGHSALNTTLYSGGTNGDYCSPSASHGSDNCLKLTTNDLNNWSRRFQW